MATTWSTQRSFLTLNSCSTSTLIGPSHTIFSPYQNLQHPQSSCGLGNFAPISLHFSPVLLFYMKTKCPTQNTNNDFIPFPTMSLWFSNLVRLHLTTPWPILAYAATWITLLTLTVAVASISPQVTFVSAISPSSSFSRKCRTEGSIRMPLDVPGDILCFPAHLFIRSKVDLIVPPVFAAIIVAASACVLRAVGLWEHDLSRPDDAP